MATKAEFLASLPFKLGQNVEAIDSGLVGMINAIVLYDSGMVHYWVQPKGDGTTIPDAHGLDGVGLNLVDEGASARAVPVIETPISNGMKVRDTVSGLEGVVSGEMYFLNGCILFGIQPPLDKDKKYQKPIYFDYTRIAQIEEQKESPAAPRTQGGPSTRRRDLTIGR